MNRTLVYWLPIAVLAVALCARLGVPELLDRFSLVAFDIYQQVKPRQSEDLPVRIVDIDDRSLRKIGQWPWSRGTIAALVDKLREAGALVVVFDVLFAEPDRTSPQELLPLLTRSGVGKDEAERVLATMPDPDERLAEAISQMPVVLGFALTGRGGNGAPELKASFGKIGGAGMDPLVNVKNYSEAVVDRPILQHAASGAGFVNPYPDWDNVLRKVAVVQRLDGKPVPSLAAEALRLATSAKTYLYRGAGANAEKSYGENTGLNAVKVGPSVIPTTGDGLVWLYYGKPDPARYVSAADIFNGTFDKSRIADHIVYVGTSAAGLNDLHATPFGPNTPGVEIHAQLIEQVMQGQYLARPDWMVGAEAAYTFFAALLIIFLLPHIGALGGVAVAANAMIIAVGLSWFGFRDALLLADPVYPVVVLGVVYLMSALLGHRQTERRQREVRQAFSRYMSPAYVAELARHPEKLVLGGEMKTMTIMFCDIRGFTTLSEGLDAQTLTMIMNGFLSPMTDIITAHRGTIDKYIGDCIMAFWNAPLDDPDHAKNAVIAAQEMRRKLDELNQNWDAEAARKGQTFKPLRFGIGINTGECCVGNFGSRERFNYSLLGDPVNLASRLEGLGKVYGVDLIIGETTAELLDDPGLVELDLVAVKGKSRATRIYTLPPHRIEAQEFLDRHAALLDAYRRRDWNAALGMLADKTLAAERDLAPVYDLFRHRIEQLQIEPPPQNWDGVFVAQEK